MAITNRAGLDTGLENEVVLEILSYSGGEDTITEDHAAPSNIARTNENWEAISLGGMERANGFNRVASAAGTTASDLAHFHYEDSTGSSEFLGIIGGDLVKKDGTGITTVTAGVFTSGKLSHATEGEDDSWITNVTDNLRRYTIAGGLTTPSDQPTEARARIYRFKNRLIAEGGDPTIYGSRTGAGNWTAADAWSLANDAFSIDLPDPTQGAVPYFPSANEVAVFTEFQAFTIFNFPDVAFRAIPNSRGCSAPYSVALGEEGVYFLSKFPTLGIFVWDGTRFTDLTDRNDDVFVDKIDFDNRIYGIYRDRKYYLFYNESGSGETFPNRLRVFDARFGRWMYRKVNEDLSDDFGYPELLTKQNNEFYTWSSQKRRLYELETADTSDEGQNTEASYKTKDFTSRDWQVKASGGRFPSDEVKIKLHKITLTTFGTTGSVGIVWTADRGRVSDTLSYDVSSDADGDLINTTFTVNTSKLVGSSSLVDKTIVKSVSNAACGRTFNFQVTNQGTGTKPKVKKIKVHGIAITED